MPITNNMLVSDITDYLETVAPRHLQESYDNAGLITGQEDWEIKGVLISLDTTPAIVAEAIKRGCNMIVAHHPIIFRGLKKINGKNYVEQTIIDAIKNDIAIYAIHTNLDNVYANGVNQKIASQLGLINARILSPKDINEPTIGSGMVGELREPMSIDRFLSFLKTTMKVGCIRHTALVKPQINTVALCGGSGSFLIANAINAQADIYISADIKYHEFFDADGKIIIADIGHYESEQYTIELLGELLNSNFSNFAAHLTNLNTNPIKYY